MEDREWLKDTVAEMACCDAGVSRHADLRLLGYPDASQLAPQVFVYLKRLVARGAGCSAGNFEFWSPKRLQSKADSPAAYGGDADLLIVADWMLDSEFCAVDVHTGMMVFLGGANPIRSKLSLAEFLERVASNPSVPHGMQ